MCGPPVIAMGETFVQHGQSMEQIGRGPLELILLILNFWTAINDLSLL